MVSKNILHYRILAKPGEAQPVFRWQPGRLSDYLMRLA